MNRRSKAAIPVEAIWVIADVSIWQSPTHLCIILVPPEIEAIPQWRESHLGSTWALQSLGFCFDEPKQRFLIVLVIHLLIAVYSDSRLPDG